MNAPFYERPSYVNTSEVYGLSKEPGEDLRQISRIVIRGDITGYIRIFLRRQIYYGYILRRRVEPVRKVRKCLSFNNLFFIFLFIFFLFFLGGVLFIIKTHSSVIIPNLHDYPVYLFQEHFD